MIEDRVLLDAWRALAPVADRIVVIGGSAHRLFGHHPLAEGTDFELLTTEDVDIATPLELVTRGSRELLERLQAHGFREEVRGAATATAVYVHETIEHAYLQFVAPRRGGEATRTERPSSPGKSGGLLLEVLGSIDILLHDPWTLLANDGGREVEIRVVRPVNFIVQKLLIRERRGMRERAKDLLYVHDTLVMFSARLAELEQDSHGLGSRLSATKRRRARRAFEAFVDDDSNDVRRAVEIARAQGRVDLDASLLRTRIRRGLPVLAPWLLDR